MVNIYQRGYRGYNIYYLLKIPCAVKMHKGFSVLSGYLVST
ncbi:hypothetical protein CLOBOL_03794 [Enterocloster bolteae ATCC BAA-613]|uniref:Uncharacterized protein n=1 Tax=Enterocloster bolteae (strain ATCC BAA-613 / DSM 15670 / CCUG 46953 / JCM 12243 / WAL 16351) TaxID=411902 RepID=A8RTU5_ENTBW|nr:hypothetical protein CLOBOL_03794 [Enterocloster bolteae ATCC BAA-613]